MTTLSPPAPNANASPQNRPAAPPPPPPKRFACTTLPVAVALAPPAVPIVLVQGSAWRDENNGGRETTNADVYPAVTIQSVIRETVWERSGRVERDMATEVLFLATHVFASEPATVSDLACENTAEEVLTNPTADQLAEAKDRVQAEALRRLRKGGEVR